VQDVQQTEMLAFVFVQALDLHIKQRISTRWNGWRRWRRRKAFASSSAPSSSKTNCG
jgi:hypothetical protein